MHAVAEGRGDAPGDRHAHETAALDLPRRIHEAAALTLAVTPADELHAAVPGGVDEARVLELPDLDLAGGGARLVGDDVERVGGADVADRHARGDCLDVRLDHARGDAGGAHRAVEAVTHQPAHAQRCAVDADRPTVEQQVVARAVDREVEVEAGTEAQPLERARLQPRRAATHRQRQDRAGLELVERHRAADQRHDARGLVHANAGALQRLVERVAACQRHAQVDLRPLGRLGQAPDEAGCRHASPGGGAEPERRDGLRAGFLKRRAGQDGRRVTEHGREARPRHPCRGDQRGAGRRAAPPGAAADVLAEIGYPVGARGRVAQAIDERRRRGRVERRGHERTHPRRRNERAHPRGASRPRQFQPLLFTQKQCDVSIRPSVRPRVVDARP